MALISIANAIRKCDQICISNILHTPHPLLRVCEGHPPVADQCPRAEGRNKEYHERPKRSETTMFRTGGQSKTKKTA